MAENSLLNKVAEALRGIVAAANVGTTNLYLLKNSDEKDTPSVNLGASIAREDPPGSGNFWVQAEALVKTRAAIDTDGTDPKDNSDDIVSAVYEALNIDDLATQMMAQVTGLTVFGFGEDGELEKNDSGDHWVEAWRKSIYCCGNSFEIPFYGYYTVPGDPLSPSLIFNDVEYGLVPYELSVVDGTQELHWNFLSTFTPTPTDGGNPIFPVTAMYLQRSPSKTNMPNGESAPVVTATLSEIAASLAQTGWETIMEWGPVADLNDLPTSYTDTAPPDTVWNYRLLLILNPFNTFDPDNPGGGADDHRMEIDYNIVSVVKRGGASGRIQLLRLYGGQAGVNAIAGFVGNKIAVDVARDAVVITGYINYTANAGNGPIASYGRQDAFVAKWTLSTGVCDWAYNYGQVSEDQFNGCAIDSAGNIYAIGQVSGGVVAGMQDFGFGSEANYGDSDVLLVKFNSAGTVLWHKIYGNTAADVGTAIAIDPTDNNNVYLAGTTGFLNGPGVDFGGGAISTPASPARSAYLVKINGSDGSYGGWQKAFGSGGQDTVPRYLTCGPDGNPVIACDFLATTDFGDGVITAGGSGFSTVLAKFSKADGSLTWLNHLSSTASSQIKGLKVDANGRVFVSGIFTGTITYSPANSQATVPGDGNTCFLVNYSYATGAWGSKFGTFSAPSTTSLFDLAIDSAGAVVLVGQIDNGIDFGEGFLLGEAPDVLLVKYNSLGTLVMAKRGAPYGDDARTVAIGPVNMIIMSGTTGDPGLTGLRGSNFTVIDPPLVTVQTANVTKRGFWASVWP